MQLCNTGLAKINQYLLLLCTVVIISACATRVDNVHRVILDNGITYVLQPIPNKLINTGIQALFTVKQQGKKNQFLMQVEMTQSQLLISGMTVEGLSLFTFDWQTQLGTLNYDKKIAIEPLRVLAELQLVLWPLADIAQGLEGAEMKVITKRHREISSAQGIIYQIKQQANISHLINLKQHYSITIAELERWQLTKESSANNNLPPKVVKN